MSTNEPTPDERGLVVTLPSATGPREPVRIGYAIFTFVQAVIVLLAANGWTSSEVTALLTGLATAAYALVQELLVRPNVSSNATVAREVTEALYAPVPSSPRPDAST